MPPNTDSRDFALCILVLAALAVLSFVWAGGRITKVKGSSLSISATYRKSKAVAVCGGRPGPT